MGFVSVVTGAATEDYRHLPPITMLWSVFNMWLCPVTLRAKRRGGSGADLGSFTTVTIRLRFGG